MKTLTFCVLGFLYVLVVGFCFHLDRSILGFTSATRRYSLRALMIAVTLVAVALGLIAAVQ